MGPPLIVIRVSSPVLPHPVPNHHYELAGDQAVSLPGAFVTAVDVADPLAQGDA